MNIIKSAIRTVPDYPHEGIMFRDITTLLSDPGAFTATIDAWIDRYHGLRIAHVVGIEARGFMFGATLAHALGAGFIPIRKKGKLPHTTISEDYNLEYGTDTVEIHKDALKSGERVLLVDDLIATGGTATAAISLLNRVGAKLVECCFVVELPELEGRKKLEKLGYVVHTLVEFAGA